MFVCYIVFKCEADIHKYRRLMHRMMKSKANAWFLFVTVLNYVFVSPIRAVSSVCEHRQRVPLCTHVEDLGWSSALLQSDVHRPCNCRKSRRIHQAECVAGQWRECMDWALRWPDQMEVVAGRCRLQQQYRFQQLACRWACHEGLQAIQEQLQCDGSKWALAFLLMYKTTPYSLLLWLDEF